MMTKFSGLPFVNLPGMVQVFPIGGGHPFSSIAGQGALFTPYGDPLAINAGPMVLRSNPLLLKIGPEGMRFGWKPSDDPQSHADLLARRTRASSNPYDNSNVDAIFAESLAGYESVHESLVGEDARIQLMCSFTTPPLMISPRQMIKLFGGDAGFEGCRQFCANLMGPSNIELLDRELDAFSTILYGAIDASGDGEADEAQTIQFLNEPVGRLIRGALLSRRVPHIYWQPTSAHDIERICDVFSNIPSPQSLFHVVPILRGIISAHDDVTRMLMGAYGMFMD